MAFITEKCAFRITQIFEDATAGIQEFCRNLPGKVVVVKEEADTEVNRTHWHGYCDGLKQQALTKRILAAFPECRGNKGYSNKKVGHTEEDYENYLNYMMKGKKDTLPVVEYAFPPLEEAEIQTRHQKYWRKNEEIRTTTRKQTNVTMLHKKVVEKLGEAQLPYESEVGQAQRYDEVRRQIGDIILDWFIEEQKPIGITYVKMLVNAVELNYWNNISTRPRQKLLYHVTEY